MVEGKKRFGLTPTWQVIIFIAMFALFAKFVCGGICSSSGDNKGKRTADDKYMIEFSKDFKKGMASVDDLGLSIVIAVDCSGSMSETPAAGGDKKYIQAAASLTEIVTFLENFYKARKGKEKLVLKTGLISFNDQVTTLYPLTEMNEAEFQKLKELTSNVNNFNPGGNTAIGRTMEAGTEMLVQSGTIFKSLIIISDGENTSGVEPNEVLDAVVNNRNASTTLEEPVYTSGVLVSFVSFDVSSDKFAGLNKIGARVTSAGNKVELLSSLKSIFVADITKLEAK